MKKIEFIDEFKWQPKNKDDFLLAKEFVQLFYRMIFIRANTLSRIRHQTIPPLMLDDVFDADVDIEFISKNNNSDEFCIISWQTYDSCGSLGHSIEIPIRYFWEENWEEDAKLEYEKQQEEKRKERLAANRKLKLQRDQMEYKRYLELKKKFE